MSTVVMHLCRLGSALVLIASALATVPLAAAADTPEDCGAIADRIERAEDIPPGLLHAVALAESGRRHPVHGRSLAWPWTVRSGPDSFYLPSKEAALSKVRELRAAGRSNIDVGCMQINLGYHGTAFASLEEAFDPVSNVAYAARFLKQLRQETRSWAKATGRYHSAERGRGEAYRARVYQLWRDLRRRQGGGAPMIAEAQFLTGRVARLVGNVAPAGADEGPRARLIVPSSTGAAGSAKAAIGVLRGR